jgi:hypothetical protein
VVARRSFLATLFITDSQQLLHSVSKADNFYVTFLFWLVVLVALGLLVLLVLVVVERVDFY